MFILSSYFTYFQSSERASGTEVFSLWKKKLLKTYGETIAVLE